QRESYFKALGIPVFDSVFKWAHAADPDALLFYNDYNAEDMSPKSNKVFELVSGLVARNAPIHGVGFQTHLINSMVTPAWFSAVAQNIERIGELGLKVAFTEIDVRMNVPASGNDYVTQGNVY